MTKTQTSRLGPPVAAGDPGGAGGSCIFRDPRLRLPALAFGLVMAVLSLERFLLWLTFFGRFASAPSDEVLHAFLIGLRFDVVMGSMLAAPLLTLLLAAPARLLGSRRFQRLLAAGLALLLTLAVLLSIADFYFFVEFDERLDHKLIDYAGTDYVLGIIWDQFPVVGAMIAVLAAGASLFLLFRRVLRSGESLLTARGRVAATLVCLPLLVLGIRGSTGPKAINSGPAFFSDSMTLAQLALNGLFTLRETIDSRLKHETLAEKLELLPEEEAIAIAREALAGPGDRFVGDPLNPLRRVTNTGRPERPYNVVLVVMESLNWLYVGSLGGHPGLTPHLDELAAHGLLMDRCFAVGSRTPYGFCGTVAGFPDLPGGSVTTRSESEGNFFTLGSVLERRGYETIFIYGGDPLYDHRQAFLKTNGFSTFVFGQGFSERHYRTHLGWCDEDLFAQAHEEFIARGGQPFLAVLLTLSFHRPYGIPGGRVEAVDPETKEGARLTSVRYADWAIGQFIEKARQAEYFERTLFVFVADHTSAPSDSSPLSPGSYRIPFLIYAPGVIGEEERRVSTICSQTWVAPTILSLLGGSYEHTFFGNSVLDRPAEDGWALMLRTNRAMAFMDAQAETIVVPFGGESRTYRYEAPATLQPLDGHEEPVRARRAVLERQSIAILQTAEMVFRRGAYNLHERRDGGPGALGADGQSREAGLRDQAQGGVPTPAARQSR